MKVQFRWPMGTDGFDRVCDVEVVPAAGDYVTFADGTDAEWNGWVKYVVWFPDADVRDVQAMVILRQGLEAAATAAEKALPRCTCHIKDWWCERHNAPGIGPRDA